MLHDRVDSFIGGLGDLALGILLLEKSIEVALTQVVVMHRLIGEQRLLRQVLKASLLVLVQILLEFGSGLLLCFFDGI